MLVRLPGQKTIVVDAKAPLEAYLEANETEDDNIRKTKLSEIEELPPVDRVPRELQIAEMVAP